MDAYSFYLYDGPDKYVDHKTVETLSREVTKIITEQIGQTAFQETSPKRMQNESIGH